MRSISGKKLNESEHEIDQSQFPAGTAVLPHIDFIKQIWMGVFETAQFPATLTDAHGSFTKPPSGVYL
jgi:uncharacterized damage-inducible protein DinB